MYDNVKWHKLIFNGKLYSPEAFAWKDKVGRKYSETNMGDRKA